MSIKSDLNALIHWHKQQQSPSAKSFLPPLNPEKIAKLLADFPFDVPKNVQQLYQLCNGQKDNSPLFLSYTLLPLREALDEYELTSEELGEDDLEWKSSWLPLFGFQGDYYVIECDILSPRRGMILYRPAAQGMVEAVYPWYDSLEQMLLTLRSCFEKKAYFLDDDEILNENFESANAIREQLNPKSAKLEIRKPEPIEQKVETQPDGSKRLTTWYSEDHYIDQFYGPDERKTGQSEYFQGELLRRENWKYLSEDEVEITAENVLGMMMVTKTHARILADGQLETLNVQTFLNDQLLFDMNELEALEEAVETDSTDEEPGNELEQSLLKA